MESLERISQRRDALVNAMPGSNLAAYGVYRELLAAYAVKLAGPNAAKIQDEWLDQAREIRQGLPASPKTRPTPFGNWPMGSESTGKDEEAKGWYRRIYREFPQPSSGQQSEGLGNAPGSHRPPLELAAPQLGTNAMFDIASLKGKVVVVYYWASKVDVCERDFVTLQRLRAAHAKDMEIVCVSLDDTRRPPPVPAQEPGGGHPCLPGSQGWRRLNSPLATTYGINGLPTLFLIGKDGRVLNRTLQVGDLEAELRRAL